MPGIDPSYLAHLQAPGGPPGQASAPPPGPAAPAKAPEPAEPVALHESCQAACEAIDAARAALEDLQQQAELADDLDPKTEKAIADAAKMIAEIDDSFDDVEKTLGESRQAHEDLVSGKGGDAA